MERQNIIDRVCEKMCDLYCECDGTCGHDNLPCCYDKNCIKRGNAKELIDELFPEGAVVLNKAEYENLKALPEKVHDEMDERMKEELAIEKSMGEKKAEQARKETAKQSCNDLIKIIKNNTDLNASVFGWATEFILNMIKAYFKEKFGVEVEE